MASHKIGLQLYSALEQNGIRLKEVLSSLRNLVVEISGCNNNLQPYYAFTKFFRDIEANSIRILDLKKVSGYGWSITKIPAREFSVFH